jgi:hypothetical protein
MHIIVVGMAAVAVGVLSGCAVSGSAGLADPPKLTWLSYVSGDDLRAGCGPGEPDHYRLINNAEDNAHIRAFDVRAEADGPDGGAIVEARAILVADLPRFDPGNPHQSWQDEAVSVHLTPEQFGLLTDRMAESGAFDPPPMGLRLPADGYFWLVSGCRMGSYFLSAFVHPADRFQDIRMLLPAPNPPAATTSGSVVGQVAMRSSFIPQGP